MGRGSRLRRRDRGPGFDRRGSLVLRIAIDTNRYVDLCRNVSDAVDVVEGSLEVYVPLIVLAELRAGFSAGTKGVANERVLAYFLRRPDVRVLSPDEQTTHHYAAVYRQLRRQGTPIPTNDMWIGALVLQHDLALFARDAHFDHLPQIRRI